MGANACCTQQQNNYKDQHQSINNNVHTQLFKPLSRNHFKNVNNKTSLLISGYTKLIEINEQIIPTSIIQIIIKFYHLKLIIFYLEQVKYATHPPIIRIAQLENNTHSQCIVTPLDDTKIVQYHVMDSDRNPVCYVNNFSIPSNILSLNDKLSNNKSYHILFSLASNGNNECVAYIIDPTNIGTDIPVNIYYWRLPNSPQSLNNSSAVYSTKYGLISCNHNALFALNFNNKETENELKWQTLMHFRRESPASTFISENKLFHCGYRTNATAICDFKAHSWVQLACMNHERGHAGIFHDEFDIKRVYVGGGTFSKRTFEYYDIEKNEWYLLPNTNGDHESYPSVWQDDVNIINIASPYSGLFEKLDVRENQWNIYKNNSELYGTFGTSIGPSFDHLFGGKVKQQTRTTRFIISN